MKDHKGKKQDASSGAGTDKTLANRKKQTENRSEVEANEAGSGEQMEMYVDAICI
jgi:hypothetical protein